MEKFRHIDTWVFDLDNTLYDAETGVFERIGERMTLYVADLLGLPLQEAGVLRKGYWEKYGTTLHGLMKEHKIDPDSFLAHAHDIDISDVPQCTITKEYLAHLPGKKIVFTNSSREFAARMTKHLGLDHHFDSVFTIEDTGFMPKPFAAPYHTVITQGRFDPKAACMFEDMEINLKTAADLGMTTVWLHGKDKEAAVRELSHVHHRSEKLSDWLQHTVKKK
jgi:putative hydrolase of the HAD superfamily